MFGKKENTHSTTVQRTSTSSMQHNSLVSGTHVEGTITSENDFRIDGSFKGTLTCKARVIIGPSGKFNGDIVCQNAIIEGIFNGKLDIHDVLEVREGARIEGDVTTGKLQVQAGSVFDVKCVMGERESKGSDLKEEIMIESLVEESANGKTE